MGRFFIEFNTLHFSTNLLYINTSSSAHRSPLLEIDLFNCTLLGLIYIIDKQHSKRACDCDLPQNLWFKIELWLRSQICLEPLLDIPGMRIHLQWGNGHHRTCYLLEHLHTIVDTTSGARRERWLPSSSLVYGGLQAVKMNYILDVFINPRITKELIC